jgi:hypothetical protein
MSLESGKVEAYSGISNKSVFHASQSCLRYMDRHTTLLFD